MIFWICSSVADCSITMTMGSSLLLFLVHGEPLQAAALVNDSLEDAPHGRGIQRPRVLAHDPLQDPGLSLRRVDREAEGALHLADLHRARRTAVEQPHQLLVDRVDAAPPLVDGTHTRSRGRLCLGRQLQIALLSHVTCPATSPWGCSWNRTSALPTTTASATEAAAATCSGVEIPNPRATGSRVSALMRDSSGRASSESASLSPVTPVRLIAYTKPREAPATRRSLSSGLVGAARKTVSRPASRATSSQPPASSGGRSVTSTPSTPAAAASRARRSEERRVGKGGRM